MTCKAFLQAHSEVLLILGSLPCKSMGFLSSPSLQLSLRPILLSFSGVFPVNFNSEEGTGVF